MYSLFGGGLSPDSCFKVDIDSEQYELGVEGEWRLPIQGEEKMLQVTFLSCEWYILNITAFWENAYEEWVKHNLDSLEQLANLLFDELEAMGFTFDIIQVNAGTEESGTLTTLYQVVKDDLSEGSKVICQRR